MSDTIWNTEISTFYIGYLVGQLPGNLWLAKSNPSKVFPAMMLAWSIATICMPAVKSYTTHSPQLFTAITKTFVQE